MNIRIKFEKYGPMRFLGHLDLMRYFQKALRRADFPLEFSKGFHPHPIMSFAQPLSVGVTSQGEYFDVKLTESIDTDVLLNNLNNYISEGIHISKIVSLPDNSKNSMSLVAGARYLAFPKDENISPDVEEKISEFFSADEIMYTKKTKKNEITTDIKPFIYEFKTDDINEDNEYGLPAGKCFNLFLKAGSEFNLTANAVLGLFYGKMSNGEIPDFGIHRVDLYQKKDEGLFPLII